jgi:hypothetical protein
VLFESLVRESVGAAVVTARESSSSWDGGRIYTFTRLHVELPVAGELPPGDLLVRTKGGVVGEIGQMVEGEPRFAPGETSLVFLHSSSAGVVEVTARAQGQFPVQQDAHRERHLAIARDVGMLVAPPSGRLAADVLREKSVSQATREIAVTWTRVHGAK